MDSPNYRIAITPEEKESPTHYIIEQDESGEILYIPIVLSESLALKLREKEKQKFFKEEE